MHDIIFAANFGHGFAVPVSWASAVAGPVSSKLISGY
jgi:hypothetical protein